MAAKTKSGRSNTSTPNTKIPNSPSRLIQLKTVIASDTFQIIFGLLLFLFSSFVLISIVSFLFTGTADFDLMKDKSIAHIFAIDEKSVLNWGGKIGALFSYYLINRSFGFPILFLLFFLFQASMRMILLKKGNIWRSFFITSALTIWSSILIGLSCRSLYQESYYWGGVHGHFIADQLIALLGVTGTILLMLGLFAIMLVLIYPRTTQGIHHTFSKTGSALKYKRKPTEDSEEELEDEETTEDELEEEEESQEETPKEETYTIPQPIQPLPIETKKEEKEELPTQSTPFIIQNNRPSEQPTEAAPIEEEFKLKEREENVILNEAVRQLDDYDPTLELARYKYPTFDLLRQYNIDSKVISEEEGNENKNRITDILRTFGISIASISATPGPTVTLYKIVPDVGVKISKIRNLEDDIALSLAALGIRIIAPIPGEGAVGIEVPNKNPQIVPMHSIIASKKFQESTFDLPVAFGKTITNEIFMVDLAKMPHMLVAGATGQGKSVGLNAIIASLLYKKHPSQLKFVLIDPKKVEFSIYNHIENHFLAKLPDAAEAIITDVSKVVQTLNSVVYEMELRYDLLKLAGTRNVKEYNEKYIKRRLLPTDGHRFFPYIVVIIDEFGDLIMTAGKEIELPINRIAQMARAVGIHMIIATQRPSTNIITGSIKANFPARVAFRVSSMIDSRTIIDSPGANQLIGRGDMLFSQGGGSDATRVQCAFIDTPEVEQISEFIGSQIGYAHPFHLPEVPNETGDGNGDPLDAADRDPRFEEAARMVVAFQQGSTSWLQRKMAIGYNRAGRLTDQLEAAKIVSTSVNGKREVLVMDEIHLDQILNNK